MSSASASHSSRWDCAQRPSSARRTASATFSIRASRASAAAFFAAACSRTSAAAFESRSTAVFLREIDFAAAATAASAAVRRAASSSYAASRASGVSSKASSSSPSSSSSPAALPNAAVASLAAAVTALRVDAVLRRRLDSAAAAHSDTAVARASDWRRRPARTSAVFDARDGRSARASPATFATPARSTFNSLDTRVACEPLTPAIADALGGGSGSRFQLGRLPPAAVAGAPDETSSHPCRGGEPSVESPEEPPSLPSPPFRPSTLLAAPPTFSSPPPRTASTIQLSSSAILSSISRSPSARSTTCSKSESAQDDHSPPPGLNSHSLTPTPGLHARPSDPSASARCISSLKSASPRTNSSRRGSSLLLCTVLSGANASVLTQRRYSSEYTGRASMRSSSAHSRDARLSTSATDRRRPDAMDWDSSRLLVSSIDLLGESESDSSPYSSGEAALDGPSPMSRSISISPARSLPSDTPSSAATSPAISQSSHSRSSVGKALPSSASKRRSALRPTTSSRSEQSPAVSSSISVTGAIASTLSGRPASEGRLCLPRSRAVSRSTSVGESSFARCASTTARNASASASPRSSPKPCSSSMHSPISLHPRTSLDRGVSRAMHAAKRGARLPVANTRSQMRIVTSVGRTLTKSVRSHCDEIMPQTMLSGARVSRWRPTAGRWMCSSLANTLWSSLAAAMPSLK